MELTKEEFAAFVVANERLQILISLIENSVTEDFEGKPWFNSSAFCEAMRMAGIDIIDKAFEKIEKKEEDKDE